jgi:nucleoside-diphosphate-sugar epimerase
MAADDNFRPIILRQATVYGWAPRMRFDLVVNTMTKYGVCGGKITINSPHLWRPLVHIRDLVDLYLQLLKMPDDIAGTFNVLSNNYTILQIGKEVRQALLENNITCELELQDLPDPRSYRLNGEKARKMLGFTPKMDIRHGVQEILDKVGDASQPAWTNQLFINAEVYRKKILAEESTYKLWRRFLSEFKGEFDHLYAINWPQEGP